MTLKEFGPSYSTFTFTDLKISLQSRGIEGPYGDRKQMIRKLRQVDRDTTFRFLDLPPELRNLVYADALTLRHGRDKFSAKSCHPSILATCTQVFEEASGILNGEGQAEVSIDLWRREYRPGAWDSSTECGFNVYFKGAALAIDSQPSDHAQVEWPALLRRVRAIKLKINLQSATQPGSGLLDGEPRDIQVNHALYSLYTFLSEKCKAKSLEMEVSSELVTPDRRVRRVISPICALAGRFEITAFEFSNLSIPFAEELKAASALFHTLFGLKDEVKLAREINSRVHHCSAIDLELYARHLHPQLDQDMLTFRDSSTVEQVIQEVEDAIKQALNEETEDLSGEMADAMKLLKEKQEQRKMAAKQKNVD